MVSMDAYSAGFSILIVDDERFVREVLVRALEREGHNCETASNAAEARERLTETEFDLIVCDVDMPGESGLELVGSMLAQRPFLAAVMMSGIDDARIAADSLELGVQGYLVKPFAIDEARACIGDALARRRPRPAP